MNVPLLLVLNAEQTVVAGTVDGEIGRRLKLGEAARSGGAGAAGRRHRVDLGPAAEIAIVPVMPPQPVAWLGVGSRIDDAGAGPRPLTGLEVSFRALGRRRLAAAGEHAGADGAAKLRLDLVRESLRASTGRQRGIQRGAITRVVDVRGERASRRRDLQRRSRRRWSRSRHATVAALSSRWRIVVQRSSRPPDARGSHSRSWSLRRARVRAGRRLCDGGPGSRARRDRRSREGVSGDAGRRSRRAVADDGARPPRPADRIADARAVHRSPRSGHRAPARGRARPVAVLIIDLDNFGHVNETLGHRSATCCCAKSPRGCAPSFDARATASRASAATSSPC